MMWRRSCPLPGGRRLPWYRRWPTAATAKVNRYLSGQAAHPRGAVGLLIARNWIRETAAVNDIALDLLAARRGERIAELGCGPGRTLDRLAAAGAQSLGVDISSDMVRLAAHRNAAHVAAGRLRVVEGDGTALPIGDGELDGAISVHSLYFWPDPPAVLAELHRALRPGGRLVLAFRAGEHPLPRRFDPAIYHVPTTSEAIGWLCTAGFTDVREQPYATRPTTAWLVAVKPGRAH